MNKVASSAAKLIRTFRCFHSNESGATIVVIAFFFVAAMMMMGVAVQGAIGYQVHRSLQASSALAALAGAQDINCCQTAGTAIATAKTYGTANSVKGQTVTMSAGYPMLKCLSSTGVSCAGTDSANAIVVKQQATVPLVLGGLFGQSSLVISATATASSSGSGGPLDVILIVDTTGSMNGSDTSCSKSGATRLTCATTGAQTLLQGFAPSQVHVGLMLFPGLTSSSQAQYEYDCSTSPSPSIAKYSASPVYQAVALSSDYKVADTSTSLNTNSNLVRALKGGPTNCQQGMDAIGGVATYYAGVIAAAQSSLQTSGRSGVQKVIIFLSDGDANASLLNVPIGKSRDQCHQGITAAQAATAAGIWVYSAAYGASTDSSSSCSTDTTPISACSAMQQIASTQAMFFADQTGGTSSCHSSVNGSSELVTMFKTIGSKLGGGPRLLPNGTT